MTFKELLSAPRLTVLIRKRWPSDVTSQYQLFSVAPPPNTAVWNNGFGRLYPEECCGRCPQNRERDARALPADAFEPRLRHQDARILQRGVAAAVEHERRRRDAWAVRRDHAADDDPVIAPLVGRVHLAAK